MNSTCFDPHALIDAMAPFLDLPVSDACREGVAVHLAAARRIADSVLALDLDDEAEPAPVFRP